MVAKPQPSSIPDTPGSYQFLDESGRVIYVGKAKSLRSRVSSYFGTGKHPRTAAMVNTAASVEWIQVANDVEALMLEYNLIKKHRPRFNVRLVDDKSYPYLALTVSHDWPRPHIVRGKKRKGTKYFGPYAHAYAVRNTLDELLKIFPLRSCSDAKLNRHAKLGKPCLLFHIDKCSGPCVDAVSKEQYKEYEDGFTKFLNGSSDEVVTDLTQKMSAAASKQEFEQAGRLRDQLAAIERTLEVQTMVGSQNENFDLLGFADSELEAVVYIFFVRNGRVVGQRSVVLEKSIETDASKLVDDALEQLYGSNHEPAKKIYLPKQPSELELYQDWLSLIAETPVELKVPQRGAKAELQKTAETNAKEVLSKHQLRRAGDYNSRAKSLAELAQHLELDDPPLRIECYDMSHLQGTNYVGSMVVFEDGLETKSEYRRFKIRTVDENDDYAAMYEVVSRRLDNYLKERELPASERGKFAYPPDLLMVDGGKGQLGVAVKAVRERGLENQIDVCSIAKKFEEVFVPDRNSPIVIPRGSESLYLLQRLRDESHRFAIEYHRKLRRKALAESELDTIAGLGPARKKKLLTHFGSLNKVKQATNEELQALTWLPNTVATAIYKAFHS